MRKLFYVICAAAMLATAGAAAASTTYHGTFTQAGTWCGETFSPAAPGTVGGTWNLNVKDKGQVEISIVIFRDGKNQANWAFVAWQPAADNNPDSYYH